MNSENKCNFTLVVFTKNTDKGKRVEVKCNDFAFCLRDNIWSKGKYVVAKEALNVETSQIEEAWVKGNCDNSSNSSSIKDLTET